jgi:uncharacterized membrane protein SpoIIM required for sporulation
VDVDAFVAERAPSWRRLDELARRARRSGRMGADDVSELVSLYQRTSADLSAIRSRAPDPLVVAPLTRTLASAHLAIYGARGSAARSVVDFLRLTFPAAVWHLRRLVAVSAVLLLVPMAAMGWWIATSDSALEASAPEEVREAVLESEFEEYYSSEPAAQFSTRVFVNNVQVAILAFASGVTLGIGTVYILVFNGLNVGLALGLFTHAGRWQQFWGLILPHGLLELSAVVVAGAAGLSLGWAVIAPGDRRRRDALAEAGRRSIGVVVGTVLAFLVAGLIEAFVTPSDLPAAARLAIGVVAWAAFVVWVVAVGRPAAAAGLTGLPGERWPDPGDTAAAAQMRWVALSSR